MHLAGDQCVEGRAHALEWHTHDIDAGHCFKEFSTQVCGRTGVGAGIVELRGFIFGQSNQRAHRFHWQRRMHDQYVGRGDRERYGGEVTGRIERHAFTQIGQQKNRRTINQQRMAVGCGFHYGVAGDDAACTAAIVDHDLLAETDAHLARQHARNEIHAATGFGGEQADRFVWVRLGAGDQGGKRKRNDDRQ